MAREPPWSLHTSIFVLVKTGKSGKKGKGKEMLVGFRKRETRDGEPKPTRRRGISHWENGVPSKFKEYRYNNFFSTTRLIIK